MAACVIVNLPSGKRRLTVRSQGEAKRQASILRKILRGSGKSYKVTAASGKNCRGILEA